MDLLLPEPEMHELLDFCKPGANRFAVLTDSLIRRNIPYNIIELENCRHILLPMAQSTNMDTQYYRVMLVAHYDRVEGSPGANDNSAAVFQLLSHAQELYESGQAHNTQILFTDKEELIENMKAQEQGIWKLAEHLKRLKIHNILFFVLDMCGIGNIPVWGRSLQKAGIQPPNDSISRAHKAMERFLLKLTGGIDYGINPMFSDDLGLLLAGYPAMQLSLLPHDQAKQLGRMNPGQHMPLLSESPAIYRQKVAENLPHAWQVNHGPGDTLDTLEQRAFHFMQRLLRNMAHYRFPLS